MFDYDQIVSQIYSYVPIIIKKSRSWAYYEPMLSPISDYWLEKSGSMGHF